MKTQINWSDIMATEQFKSLTKIQQRICLKKSSVREIRQGISILENMDWEQYVYLNQPTYINRLIIKELSQC